MHTAPALNPCLKTAGKVADEVGNVHPQEISGVHLRRVGGAALRVQLNIPRARADAARDTWTLIAGVLGRQVFGIVKHCESHDSACKDERVETNVIFDVN